MGGASSYLAMLAIAGFLGATWTASKVSKLLGVSDIVLVITTGVLLGPDILGLISKEYTVCSQARHTDCEVDDLEYKIANGLSIGEHLGRIQHMDLCHAEDGHHAVPSHEESHDAHGEASHEEAGHGEAHSETGHGEEHGASGHGSHRRLSGGGNYASYEECLVKSCKQEISHECQLTPDVFTLIGHAGVALMIFESGMHFDFEKAKIVGAKACVVAVLGTVTPLITGALLTMLLGYGFFPEGISAGTALAPTSVGIALRLLGEAGVLQENFGQAIITAAFVDDILSLVLFNILFSLGGEFDFVAVVVNPVVGIAIMLIAMYAAMKFWPKFINGWLLPKVPVKEGAKACV
ncbi:High-affinity Na(+)/H(+) antiporter NhaS3 (Sodium/proton antiporter NhaS3) [Durusdinium trenchii]|uniref:High-affinity Na(+)/H(+) antiporter NhaS3 (Sodium/proton antiporter NhaS3) n=1 Tax=Durusdinium trenchii TaxID=1381693 RepID=A0ABP0RGD8_9DINO